jgi:siroheme synthase (precorrin-2 oxidase/ferrochelatase)
MAEYFPLFCSLKGQTAVILGNNKAAADKAEKLQPFGPQIVFIKDRLVDFGKVLAPLKPRLVIVADKSLAEVPALYRYCIHNRIEINTVDDRKYSTFIFPAMICREKLTVAISTGGASPAAAVKLKQEAEALLPTEIDAILDWLQELRPTLKNSGGDAKKKFRALVDAAFEQNRPLNSLETEQILKKY